MLAAIIGTGSDGLSWLQLAAVVASVLGLGTALRWAVKAALREIIQSETKPLKDKIDNQSDDIKTLTDTVRGLSRKVDDLERRQRA